MMTKLGRPLLSCISRNPNWPIIVWPGLAEMQVRIWLQLRVSFQFSIFSCRSNSLEHATSPDHFSPLKFWVFPTGSSQVTTHPTSKSSEINSGSLQLSTSDSVISRGAPFDESSSPSFRTL